jgi:hypothetical protein
MPGFIAFRLEPVGGKIIVARAGGVGAARRSRRVAHHGRGHGWCRGRVPRDEPENTKGIVRNKKGSKESCEETNDHHLRGALARLPSASSLARRLLLLPVMKLLGVLVLKKESLDWQRLGEQRTW